MRRAQWERGRISYNLFDKPSGETRRRNRSASQKKRDVGNLLENVVFAAKTDETTAI